MLGPFLLEDLPTGVVQGNGVSRNQQRVAGPSPLGHVGGTALVLRRGGIANMQADLLANGRKHIDIGNIRIANGEVVLIGIVDGAEHVFEGQGYTGNRMVLENGEIDDGIAYLGKSFRYATADAPVDGEILFVTQRFVAETTQVVRARGDAQTRTFQVFIQAVPNDDVFLRDACVLKALADELDEEHVGGNAAASQAVDL